MLSSARKPVRSVSAFSNGQGYYTEIKTGRSHFPIPAPKRFLLNQFWLWFHTTQAAQPHPVLLQSLLREWLCHLSSFISGNKISRTLVHGVLLQLGPGQVHTLCLCFRKGTGWSISTRTLTGLQKPPDFTSKHRLFLMLSCLFDVMPINQITTTKSIQSSLGAKTVSTEKQQTNPQPLQLELKCRLMFQVNSL